MRYSAYLKRYRPMEVLSLHLRERKIFCLTGELNTGYPPLPSPTATAQADTHTPNTRASHPQQDAKQMESHKERYSHQPSPTYTCMISTPHPPRHTHSILRRRHHHILTTPQTQARPHTFKSTSTHWKSGFGQTDSRSHLPNPH